MTKIAIINGNPYAESYCAALAAAYEKGAAAHGSAVRRIQIGKLQFNPNLEFGYHKRMELEPDLLAAQETLRWADHLVFVYPIWWGTMPSVMKGFVDRVFLPGFAFKPKPNSLTWDKLLQGKSARLIVTMDAPGWYNRLVYKRAGHNVMKRAILQFCGVNPVRITEINSVKSSNEEKRKRWLAEVESLGARGV